MRLLVLEIFFLNYFLYEINHQLSSEFRFCHNSVGTKTWSSLMALFQFYPIKLPSTEGLLTILGANK